MYVHKLDSFSISEFINHTIIIIILLYFIFYYIIMRVKNDRNILHAS